MKYTVTILNKSGADQRYYIFSERPKVTGAVQSQIWSNVLDVSSTPADQKATLQIYKQFYATCGNSHGKPGDGVLVNVRGFAEVELGRKRDDGTIEHGSTLNMTVQKGAPFFEPTRPSPSGWVGSFRLNTDSDFTVSEAKQNNYVVGLGGSNGCGDSLAAAVFMPQPNVMYQIQPSNKYYIACGDYEQGALIDVEMIGPTAIVDFASTGATNIVIIHTENGLLVPQAE